MGPPGLLTDLLITGFGPFPRVPVNPSGTLAKRVAASPRLMRVLGRRPRCLVLRTAYAAIRDDLEPALARAPDAILMIGVATRAKRPRIESRACNRASRLFPDASGAAPRWLALEPGGPFVRRSPAARSVHAALRGLGVGASRDAGRYLCNASYYRVLAEGCPAVFLHIPPLPRTPRRAGERRVRCRRSLEAWTEVCVEAAIVLARQVRTRHRRTVRGEAVRPAAAAAE